jgi:hypothetical protein
MKTLLYPTLRPTANFNSPAQSPLVTRHVELLRTRQQSNYDVAMERYAIVLVIKYSRKNIRNRQVSLDTLLIDYSFLSNRKFLFISYNILAVFTSFLEKFCGPPKQFKRDS